MRITLFPNRDFNQFLAITEVCAVAPNLPWDAIETVMDVDITPDIWFQQDGATAFLTFLDI